MIDDPASRPGRGGSPRCPICAKPGVPTCMPFCSERCRMVDLNRWLSNRYAIPGAAKDDADRPAGDEGTDD